MIKPTEEEERNRIMDIQMSEIDKLRKNYRNIWCILRSIDAHEVKFSDPARAEEWKFYEWTKCQANPHSYFARCEPAVADAIWDAVEKRLEIE